MPQTTIASSETLLEELAIWVKTETPTTDPARVNSLMDVAHRELAGVGVAITRLPGRDGYGDNLIARIGDAGAAKPILIAGHLDTVWSTGTLEQMPFVVNGDRAHGPGIYDMKAGSFAAFYAIREIARQKIPTRRPVILLLTSDEEVGSPTSREIIEREGKGAAYVLIPEPADPTGRCVTARKGVGRFEIKITGIGAHAGGNFTDGASAVVELSRQIQRLREMVDLERGITMNVAPIWGGTRPNVIASSAGGEIDLRAPTVEDGERMEKILLRLQPEDPRCLVTVTGGMNRPPFAESGGGLALYEKARLLARELGITMEKMHRGGGSDGNFTAALGVPTLDGLGCPGAGAHASFEHIQWRNLAARVALIAGLLETLD
jgi:glutamate carboxypeptidase